MSRKLPVIEIFGKSLSLVWERRAFALAISWPYLAVTAILIVVGAAAGVAYSDGQPEPKEGLDTVFSIVEGFFLAILAVYWHRNILLQETEAPAVPLRLDAYVWRYIGYLLLTVLVFVGLVGIGFGIGLGIAVNLVTGLGSAPGILLMVAIVAAGLLVLFRFSLVLPAAAVGDRSMGLRRSWRITSGNTWRLLGLQLLLVGVSVAAMGVIVGLAELLPGEGSLWLSILGNAVISWAITLVGFAVLSLVYAWFRHEAPPADAEMPD